MAFRLAEVRRIGDGFRVALRLPGMTGREVIPDPIKVMPGPTKVIPDLIRNPDLAEGLRMACQRNRFGPSGGEIRCFCARVFRFWLECDALEMDSGSRCACPE